MGRIHEPIFPDDMNLIIIWCRPRGGRQFSLAAGTFGAMQAAWPAVQEGYTRDELTMQQGARIIQIRPPTGR